MFIAIFFLSFFFSSFIQILSSCLLGISSILLIASSAKFRHPNSYAVIGRFLAGVTHGLVFHTVLIHSGELGIRNIRQLIIRPIGVSMLIGTALHYIIYLILGTSDNHFVLPGIISVVLSVIALILSFVFTYESVPWLIRCGNNPTLALQTWLILQNEPSVANDSLLIQEFNDLKKEIEETDRLSPNVLSDGNVGALLKCIGVRILAAFVSSPAIYALITLAENKDTFSLAGIIIRLFFAILWLYFLIDKLRKDEGAIPIIIVLGLELIIANVCYIFDWSNWFTYILWHLILYVLLTLPIFDYMGHIYLSELFPFAKKDWSVAYVLIIEYVVHILLIAAAVFVPWHSSHLVLLVFGTIMTALGFALYGVVNENELFMLREDRRTLRRASAAGTTINS